jgi:kynurenine formamidase
MPRCAARDRHTEEQMDTQKQFHEVAERVRNWGKWGPDDQLGTLNYITPDKLRQAASLVRQGKLFALGIDFNADGPQGPHFTLRTNPIHLMTVDGGDVRLQQHATAPGTAIEGTMASLWENGPMRFADDYIMMPLQCGTQWDALAHVWYDGKLYNGYPAECITSLGALKNGIDKADKKGVMSKAVLLDVAGHRGVPHLPPNTPITPEDLDAVAQAERVTVEPGDIVLVRTGWWGVWLRERNHDTFGSGSPGLTWRCAEWLWRKQVAAVASDTAAVEVSAQQIEGWRTSLPMHLLCIRDMGMMLGEMWNLEALAADCRQDGVYELLVCAPPLRVTGAVGSPLNPVAVK